MSAPPEDGETAGGSDDSPAAGAETDAGPPAAEVDRLRSRVSELETELDRKDAELATVRRQYEALLADDAYAARSGDGRGAEDGGVLDRLR